MKSLFNKSIFSCPSSLTRVSTALILLAMLAMSGNVWGQVTWTGGDLLSRDIDRADSRNFADFNNTSTGVYTTDDTDYTIGLQQRDKNKNNRIGFRKFTGSFSVAPYTKTTYTYTADVHAYCMDASTWNTNYPYIATEFFSFGTTFPSNFNLNTKNNTDLSTNNYSIAKATIAGPPKETEKDRTATKDFNLEGDNSTEASTKDVTLWFGLFAYSRPALAATSTASTKNRGGANFTYKSVAYTYYSTITFHANGGSGSMAQQSIENSAALTQNAYTRSGYAFAGWNTAADGLGTMYADKADFLAYNSSTNGGRGPVTLYAIWIPYYSVSFHANGGTGTMSNIPYIAMDQAFEIPDKGFTAPTYTIMFDANGGEAVSPIAKTLDFNGWEDHGDIVGSDGHTYTYDEYDGAWYANKNLDVLKIIGDWKYDKYAILHHYIQHGKGESRQPLNPTGVRGTYMVGEKTYDSETVTVSQLKGLTTTPGYTVPLYAQWVGTITLPTPTHTGDYFFDGWYDGETRVGGAGDTYAPAADQTLVAHWTKYTYFYETNGGTWDETAKWKIGASSDPAQHQVAAALPTEISSVVVRTVLTINSEVACYSLAIEGEGSVTIAPTGGLSVGAGGVTGATSANFRIQSSTANQGYFRMSPSATTPMPTATVEYATKGTLDTGADKDATWQYFGVPCSTNMTVDHTMWLNQWDVNSGWVKKAQGSDHPLLPWTGYSITQYGQPTYTFSGTLLNSNQTINLTGTDATQGMNLIANSYSAPIDVKKFEAGDFTGEAIYTFYIYNAGSWNQWEANKGATPSQSNHAPGTYTAIPAFSASLLEGEQTLIAPMQAIMVQLQGANATINFNYDRHVWRASGTGSSMTDPIRAPHRATANPADELTARVRLSVGSAGSGVDHLYMLEKTDFTGGYDNGYDAPKMATRGLVNLYTTVTEGMLAVDAKDQLENTYVGFAAGSDSEYSLHFSAVLGTEYYLLDQQTGICTQMAEGAHYDFSATPNSIDDYRFIILRQSPGISTALPNVSDSESPITEIYTISGLRMNLPLSELPKGIYIIRQGQTVNKIAIQ